MTEQQIIDNAPDGSEDWTHYADAYLKETATGYQYFCPEYGWQDEPQLDQYPNIRARQDIERIVELEKERDAALNATVQSIIDELKDNESFESPSVIFGLASNVDGLNQLVSQLRKEKDCILEDATKAIIGGVTNEDVDKWLAKRDLEQQINGMYEAKSIAKYKEDCLFKIPVSKMIGRRIQEVEEQLRNQAKGE